jgi:hypothetical protein
VLQHVKAKGLQAGVEEWTPKMMITSKKEVNVRAPLVGLCTCDSASACEAKGLQASRGGGMATKDDDHSQG